jgi:hypothetical protein
VATGKSIYVNPYAVRYVIPEGKRIAFAFSENHKVTIAEDLQTVIDSGLFEVAH